MVLERNTVKVVHIKPQILTVIKADIWNKNVITGLIRYTVDVYKTFISDFTGQLVHITRTYTLSSQIVMYKVFFLGNYKTLGLINIYCYITSRLVNLKNYTIGFLGVS